MKLQRQHFSPQLFKDPECWSGRSFELTTASQPSAQPSEPPVRICLFADCCSIPSNQRVRLSLSSEHELRFQDIPLAGSTFNVNASQPTLFFAVQIKRAKSSSPVYWTIKMLTFQELLRPELTRSEFLCQVNVG